MAKPRKQKKDEVQGGLVYSTNQATMASLFTGLREEETLPPAEQQLVVRRDTKARKGKVVTLVEGFVGKANDIESIGKWLKTACGVGGSIKDGVVLVQGDHCEHILTLLLDKGYKRTKQR